MRWVSTIRAFATHVRRCSLPQKPGAQLPPTSGLAELYDAQRYLALRKPDTLNRAKSRLAYAEAGARILDREARYEGYAGGLFGTYWRGERDYPPGRGTHARELERRLFNARQDLARLEVMTAREIVHILEDGQGRIT